MRLFIIRTGGRCRGVHSALLLRQYSTTHHQLNKSVTVIISFDSINQLKVVMMRGRVFCEVQAELIDI
jgi:hypothetical protein